MNPDCPYLAHDCELVRSLRHRKLDTIWSEASTAKLPPRVLGFKYDDTDRPAIDGWALADQLDEVAVNYGSFYDVD
ncbi:uncharacterized protein LTR77_001807 [Saxophila tyrrhenica]|uniref:Uncharacterized protein n=1 Tax=Saxophila tyrrhenica TaxID=1690608 RepID=A0AAV9PM35_9PEZI|nr:hypothetical protein LTR77_001807 [Saxophila tyrrhenica]